MHSKQLCSTGAFEDEDIIHVENSVDPIRDLEIITGELRLKDIQTIEKRLGAVSVAKRNQDKELNHRCDMEEKFLEHLRAGKDIRNGEWNSKEVGCVGVTSHKTNCSLGHTHFVVLFLFFID